MKDENSIFNKLGIDVIILVQLSLPCKYHWLFLLTVNFWLNRHNGENNPEWFTSRTHSKYSYFFVWRAANISKMSPFTPVYNIFPPTWRGLPSCLDLESKPKVLTCLAQFRFLQQLYPWRQCWLAAKMTPYLCLVGHGTPDFPENGTDQVFHTYTGKMWFACLKLWEKKITIIAIFLSIEFNKKHNLISSDGNACLPGTTSEGQKCQHFCTSLNLPILLELPFSGSSHYQGTGQTPCVSLLKIQLWAWSL